MRDTGFGISPFPSLFDAGLNYCKMSNTIRTTQTTPTYGVGVNDYDGRIKVNNKHIPSYDAWHDMLRRCYDEKTKAKSRNSKYHGCTVSDEWKYFSNFKEWFEDPGNNWRSGYCLDKDIVDPGNRVYCREKCLLVPPEINQLICFNRGDNGLPIGVNLSKTLGKYTCCVQNPLTGELEHIGTYKNVEDAFFAYKERKEKYIKLVAKIYFEEGAINERAFAALCSFEVQRFAK